MTEQEKIELLKQIGYEDDDIPEYLEADKDYDIINNDPTKWLFLDYFTYEPADATWPEYCSVTITPKAHWDKDNCVDDRNLFKVSVLFQNWVKSGFIQEAEEMESEYSFLNINAADLEAKLLSLGLHKGPRIGP